mgnify:CR=1 FL=1
MIGKPYEIFTGLSDKIELPKKYENGKIIKYKRKLGPSIYNLQIGDENDPMIIKDLITIFNNPNNALITRLISLSLRHRIFGSICC